MAPQRFRLPLLLLAVAASCVSGPADVTAAAEPGQDAYLTEDFENPDDYLRMFARKRSCSGGGPLIEAPESTPYVVPEYKEASDDQNGYLYFDLSQGAAGSAYQKTSSVFIPWLKDGGQPALPVDPETIQETVFDGDTTFSADYRISEATNVKKVTMQTFVGEKPGWCPCLLPDYMQFVDGEADLQLPTTGSRLRSPAWTHASFAATERPLSRSPRESLFGQVVTVTVADETEPTTLKLDIDNIEVSGRPLGGPAGVEAALGEVHHKRDRLAGELEAFVDQIRSLLLEATATVEEDYDSQSLAPRWRDYADRYRAGIAYWAKMVACTTYPVSYPHGSVSRGGTQNKLIVDNTGEKSGDLNCNDQGQDLTSGILESSTFWTPQPGDFGPRNFKSVLGNDGAILRRLIDGYRRLRTLKGDPPFITFTTDNPTIDFPLSSVSPSEDQHRYLAPLLKDDVLPALPNSAVEAAGAPGERVDSAVVVLSKEPLSGVSIRSEPLLREDGAEPQAELPPSAIDVKAVTSWCQVGAGSVWSRDPYDQYVSGMRRSSLYYLVNELALHDPDVFRVTAPSDDRRSCENTPRPNREDGKLQDADTLQPVDGIAPDQPQEWWVKLSIPPGAKPGIYRGNLTVTVDDPATAVAIPYEVEVRPFKLMKGLIYSAYANRTEIKAGQDGADLNAYRQDLKLIADYGFCVPFQPGFASALRFPDQVERKLTEVWLPKANLLWAPQDEIYGGQCSPHFGGLTGQAAYYLVNGAIDAETAAEDARRIVSVVKEQVEVPNNIVFAFNSVDEPSEGQVAKERPLLEAVQQAGGRNFAAFEFSNHGGLLKNSNLFDYGIIGATGKDQTIDEQYVFLADKLAGGWQDSRGLCFYNTPQFGIERANDYRENYGFNMYKDGKRCVHGYAYQREEGNPYDDSVECLEIDPFSGDCKYRQSFREHALAYSSIDGKPYTAKELEGLEAAREDSQYLQTLIHAYGLDGTPSQLEQIERFRDLFGTAQFFGDYQAMRDWMGDLIAAKVCPGPDCLAEEGDDQEPAPGPDGQPGDTFFNFNPFPDTEAAVTEEPSRFSLRVKLLKASGSNRLGRKQLARLLRSGFEGVIDASPSVEKVTAGLVRVKGGSCYRIAKPRARAQCDEAGNAVTTKSRADGTVGFRFKPLRRRPRSLRALLRSGLVRRGSYKLTFRVTLVGGPAQLFTYRLAVR